ncbi:MAG TPA: tripartite tricarboxylate transporter substrate binding protein [Alphaproteobacteria bacterium]
MRIGAWLATAILSASPAAAAAQDFPSKPIRVVVPFAPGGADVSLRVMQARLQELLGQPIVIDNRPGANGFVGADMVARAAPDGYTLLHTSSTTIVTAPLVTRTAPFDPRRDFTPITRVITGMRAVVVRKSLPVASLRELVAEARRHPGKLSFASNGVGSGQHLDGESFNLAAGIEMTHVTYKGVGPIVQALLAQEVDVSFSSVQAIVPVLAEVKPLAVYDGRPPALAALPDVTEVVPGFHALPIWIGLLGPAGLPGPMLARLSRATVAAIRSPDVTAKIAQFDNLIGANSPDEFAAEIRTGIADAAQLIKTLEEHGVRFE